MEAIIMQGVTTLNFLFSSISLSVEHTVDHIRSRLIEHPPEPVEGIVDIEFFALADKVYKDILFRHRERFGIQYHSLRDQILFEEVFKNYIKVLKKVLFNWVNARKSQLAKVPGAPQHYTKVLDGFLPRLEWVLDRALFNSAKFGMPLMTPPPLLTLLFLTDISSSLSSVKAWIDIPLLWIDPYATNGIAVTDFGGVSMSLRNVLCRFEPNSDTQSLLHEVLACISAT